MTEAVQYGASRHRHWRGVTINLTMLDSPQTADKVMAAVTDALRHWQARHLCIAAFAWVREQGPVLRDHVHMLVATPAGKGGALSFVMRRWLRGPSVRGALPKETFHTRPTGPLEWLRYALKTLSPDDAKTLYQETDFRVIPEPSGGRVVGKQFGIARALGPKARKQSFVDGNAAK